ncbi:MAG: hypothetical protein OXI79_03345 [Gammaproteobacteria bacterium]|nr:hypothetical protein [Gammaproteobacteria bacterium]
MRAALAPVIGLFGVLAAYSAGAGVELGYMRSGTAPDQNPPQRYAAETISRTGCLVLVGTNCAGYRIAASSQTINLADGGTATGAGADQMLITTKTDILLPADVYYVRYEFGGAVIAEAAGLAVTDAAGHAVAGDGTIPETATANAANVAYRGLRGNNMVIFQYASQEWGRGSEFRLQLSGTQSQDLTGTTDTDETTPGYAKIAVTKTGSITATVSIYESLTAAVDGNGALYEATGTIAQIDYVVGAMIDSMHDVADVTTSVDDGGPFRRFTATGMGGKESGVLGKTTVSIKATGHRLWSRGYRNADTGANLAGDDTDGIVGSTTASVTSEAGNFAVAVKSGAPLATDANPGGAIVSGGATEEDPNRRHTNRKPWMLSSMATCGDGPLDLGVVGGTIETYQRARCPIGSAADCVGDPDGTGATGGPYAAGDLTPAGIASANIATGDAGAKTGVNYFCVLATGNTEPIPEIGNPAAPASYKLVITPTLATATNPFKPGAVAKDVGAIDRNGTTVHVPYLSTHEAYNQRLVLVNRGADAALFWIENGSFNLENEVTLMMNNLAPDNAMSIPGKGRLVVRVQDNVEFMGATRGAATVNVAAPTRDIDVMTIQVHPGTGQIDTTVYQHAED